jgi:hypothetical protein
MHVRPAFQFRVARLVAFMSLAALPIGCGHSAESATPSAITANPANYDESDVTVTGTAKNPTTHHFRRGTATFYELCDTACINVVQFGNANVSQGSTVTATGRFHTSFGRRRIMSNVLVVGGRMRAPGGASQ